jgi:hypothetical protein
MTIDITTLMHTIVSTLSYPYPITLLNKVLRTDVQFDTVRHVEKEIMSSDPDKEAERKAQAARAKKLVCQLASLIGNSVV